MIFSRLRKFRNFTVALDLVIETGEIIPYLISTCVVPIYANIGSRFSHDRAHFAFLES